MADGAAAETINWYDPPMRGILPLDGFHIPRSLRKTVRRAPFDVRVDTAFRDVVEACGSPAPQRETTWINGRIVDLYTELFRRGHAHSVECWQDGRLVGGLYGVSLGAAFFGESMFSRETDASKVALVHLVARLIAGGYELLDTQFVTEHLNRFGAVEIPRRLYRGRLARALQRTARFPGAGGEPVAGGAPVDEGALVGALLHSSTQTS
jgi:leucyl/phenylalanyl-tRNA--protein transferase